MLLCLAEASSCCWDNKGALLPQHYVHGILQRSNSRRLPCLLHKAAHSLHLRSTQVDIGSGIYSTQLENIMSFRFTACNIAELCDLHGACSLPQQLQACFVGLVVLSFVSPTSFSAEYKHAYTKILTAFLPVFAQLSFSLMSDLTSDQESLLHDDLHKVIQTCGPDERRMP